MKNSLLSVAEAGALIEDGQVLMIAGSEGALSRLPRGRWIGGTTAYFMAADGGVVETEQVFCTAIDEAAEVRIASYDADQLPGLVDPAFGAGFIGLLIPAFSDVHRAYAMNSMSYSGIFNQPVAGWITGVLLSDLGKTTPKVFNGGTGEVLADKAVALHVRLPADRTATLDIVNLFEQGDGDTIVFTKSGFEGTDCLVNGAACNFARYVTDKAIDTQLPIIANYAGAMINVSIQSVDREAGVVKFYAPVVDGVSYRFARPVADYVDTFTQKAGHGGRGEFSCNCILNFLYAGLEGKKTGDYWGPITFGEIAYILLNQTLVRLKIGAADSR
jgi:hypothetical protein